jgi:hypothetical protein
MLILSTETVASALPGTATHALNRELYDAWACRSIALDLNLRNLPAYSAGRW